MVISWSLKNIAKLHHKNIRHQLHETPDIVKQLQQIKESNDAVIASSSTESDLENPDAAASISNVIDESLDNMDFD